MPELPEVETIRRGLEKKIQGKKIIKVESHVPKLLSGDINSIIGAKVLNIKRVGKVLEIDLSNHYSVLIHLKMTGQLVFRTCNNCSEPVEFKGGHPQKVYEQPLPHKHTHIIYTFADKSILYFNDLRKFGWNKIILTDDFKNYLGKDKFGPEPLSKDFTVEYLKKIFAKSNKKIKDFLIDQAKISGIGNIYANDALYWAGILPTRLAKTLSGTEIERLKKAIEKVIKLGIEYGGSSENTYVDVNGKRGKYMDVTATYQQKTDPKGHPLIRKKFGSRSAFYCEICQK